MLAAFTPVLAGTFPLGIDLSESDADIICEVSHHKEFEQILRLHFGHFPAFNVQYYTHALLPFSTASFLVVEQYCGEWLHHYAEAESLQASFPLRVEVFAEAQSVWRQNAVRHLFIEDRLLSRGTPEQNAFNRRAIRQLKAEGMKTEPAFARHFHLEGEPYSALLELASTSDAAFGMR